MNGAKAKRILGILLLPRIIPRARVLFASGFGYIAFLMASIYGAVRLLPPQHPYLKPENIGRFGILHVIGEAANNLVIKKENADQVFVFIALLTGAVILLAQLLMVVYAFVIRPALAGSIFLTPDPAGGPVTDLAFVVLDQVFGIPDLFCTEGGQCTPINGALPWPFHTALHELLRFYSLGLLVVGMVIFLYYALVVVGETATTGHPFGQRFQNVWVPIRLVVALGLLLPINYGLNSGQYIVLYAAKFGSGFATNGWLQFNRTMQSTFIGGTGYNPTGERNSLLTLPQVPSILPVVQAMSVIHGCAYAYWKQDPMAAGMPEPPSDGFYIRPYLVKQPQAWMTNPAERLELGPTSYVDALDFYDNGDIVIRFGRVDANNTSYDQEKGKVAPICGDIRIPISYVKTRGQGGTVGGADAIQEFYFNLIKGMWYIDNTLLVDLSQRYMEFAISREPYRQCFIGCGHAALPPCGPCTGCCIDTQVTAEARQAVLAYYQPLLDAAVRQARLLYIQNAALDFQMTVEVLDRGWAGAGLWYNVIAEINGAFVGSVNSPPFFELYPDVMEQARKERKKSDADVSSLTQFNPNLANGDPARIEGHINAIEMAKLLNDFFQWWNKDDPDMTKADKTVIGNAFKDVFNAIFGIQGLIQMRGENAHVHPLAQLAATGKSLVDSAVFNMGASTVGSGLGGLIRVIDQHTGVGAQIVSGMLMTIAMLTLTVGFILYYVLPFLPFLYFFFAFSTWIKSIFEAMVGAPLWALAHLRLDGEGLPGDSASSGYFLIFEIFVRPILTVFGLLAAVTILTAQVRVLNVLWSLVTDNLTGFEDWHQTAPGFLQKLTFGGYEFKRLPKNEVDSFFFTMIYAIIVYMMATASFKMIDKIPDQILRFMGAGVSAFSDINADPTEGLTRYAAVGGMQVAGDLTKGVQGLGNEVGGVLGKSLEKVKLDLQGPPKPPGT